MHDAMSDPTGAYSSLGAPPQIRLTGPVSLVIVLAAALSFARYREKEVLSEIETASRAVRAQSASLTAAEQGVELPEARPAAASGFPLRSSR